MAKQKFQCKGVVRKTGQRVAVEVSAESKEAAIKIAAEHGVQVEQISLAQDVTQPSPAAPKTQPAQPRAAGPQQPKPAAPPADEDADESVDHLFESPDDDLDDLNLGDDPFRDNVNAPLAPSSAPAAKFCPYCGGQIPAAAVKCKHCHEVLTPSAQMEQALIRTKDFTNASVVTLLLYFFCFWLPGLITNCIYLQQANRVKAAIGRDPPGRSVLLWLFWLCGVAPVGLAVLFVLIVAVMAIWARPSATSAQPAPVVASQPTPPPPAAPKPEAPKHSPEELAFAAKLAAFLDACDDTAKLLEGVPKPEKCAEQSKVLQARWAAVPPPPKGVKWAEDAAASAQHLVEMASAVTVGMTTLEEAMKAIGQPSDSPEARDACRKAAGEMRTALRPSAPYPPACLPK